MSEIVDSNARQRGFGETGEFVIGWREGVRINFLLPPRHLSGDARGWIPFHSPLAEPMRRGLLGYVDRS